MPRFIPILKNDFLSPQMHFNQWIMRWALSDYPFQIEHIFPHCMKFRHLLKNKTISWTNLIPRCYLHCYKQFWPKRKDNLAPIRRRPVCFEHLPSNTPSENTCRLVMVSVFRTEHCSVQITGYTLHYPTRVKNREDG